MDITLSILISVNVDIFSHHAEIDEPVAFLGLALSVAGYLVSVWFCHDFLLNKKGFRKYELLLLAVLVVGIAVLLNSILLIGIAFTLLNIIRLVRQHKQFIAIYKN